MTSLDQVINHVRDLIGQPWRHGIADLTELLGAGSLEIVVVRESLESRGLPYGQTAALDRIEVYVVMAILGDVAGNRRGWPVRLLDMEAVIENVTTDCPLNILMFGQQSLREVAH